MMANLERPQPTPEDCFPYASLPACYLRGGEPTIALQQILDKVSAAGMYSVAKQKWERDSGIFSGSNESKLAMFFNKVS